MKLTQRTLFQCFDKSRSQPLTTQNVPLCKPPSPNAVEQPISHLSQADFLLPIHIRQLSDSPASNLAHPLKRRTLENDHTTASSSQEFFRICPSADLPTSNWPKIEFAPITSTERQLELFEQYTRQHPFVDWRAMFDSFQEYRRKALEQNQHEQLLWTEIYRPKSCKAYLGNQTQQIKRLNEWFSYWTEILQNERPKKNPSKKRKRSSDDEDLFDDKIDEDSNMSYSSSVHFKPEYPQLIFIHGSGTTSLVHALAEEFNFKVTEINGSQSRARTPLLKQLEQVTSHHHLSFRRCPSDPAMSQEDKSKASRDLSSPLPAKKKAKGERGSIKAFFKGKTTSDQNNEQKENQPSSVPDTGRTTRSTRRSKPKYDEPVLMAAENNFISSVHVEKTSLILFDEIETLTMDDNFWSCLKKLLETARKPIILTSNSRTNPEDAIINLSKLGHYELIHLEPHEPDHIHCLLRLILLAEMLEVPPLDDALDGLVHSSANDIRRALSTLQFLAQSSAVAPYSPEKPPTNSKAQWQSSTAFNAMYHSHLSTPWQESLMKPLFDALTREHTEQYDQSYRTLIQSCAENTQRMELYDTFEYFMQEQDMGNIKDRPSFYLDYRPFVRQICQSEQKRATESTMQRRLRHALTFRGCSLQWPDFEILSKGLS